VSVLELGANLSEGSFSCGGVLPLMYGGVLRGDVEITQTPLKR
jgi:hypothetical protein